MEFRRVLFRSREQLRVRRGRGDDDVEEVQRYRRGAAEPWQQRVDLGYQQRAWQTGGDDGVDGVKGQVGIGRQRQLRALRVRRDLLHDAVDAAVDQRARHVRVVQARVVALRLRRAQQGDGMQDRKS